MRNLIRYYHTLKYLKPVQLIGQIKFRLRKPKFIRIKAPAIRLPETSWTHPITKPSCFVSENEITFLNQTKNISSPTIWSDTTIDKLWLYNLHYFDVLSTPAESAWQYHLIKRWIHENPPANSTAWEPYPTSLRIVNWIKWILLGNSADSEILDSLATQAHYLSKHLETHIQGNHLLANLKALLFAGSFFKGKLAQRWLTKGWICFEKEIAKQILPDGGHFELSPMYHAIVLEDLMDTINILESFGKLISHTWPDLLQQMLRWLRVMSHPNSEIAFFNDATLGIAPTLTDLTAYQERINFKGLDTSTLALTHLAASGYVRAEKNNAVLLTDVAPVGAYYQPGHAHADTLSFEFSLNGQRLFVNSGTATYAFNEEREKQRHTAAHNTVMINESNSSDVWKSFRVGRRARVHDITVNETPDHITIRASHDGYQHAHKVIHKRQWQLTANTLEIHDDISGKNTHKITLIFHLHPQITVTNQDEFHFTFVNAENKILANMRTSHPCVILNSTYHPGFNISEANKKCVIETVTTLPAQFKTHITWN